MVKAIARRWGLENANKETTEERTRSVWAQERGMWKKQNNTTTKVLPSELYK